MKSTSNMRVLLIAALAASASAATTPCGGTCVEKLFTEMVSAEAMGFTEADAATYGYLLWRGWTEGSGQAGFDWVGDAVKWIGGADACNCLEACTATKIKTCIKDATAEKTTEIDTGITNQVAPDSEPAKKWKGKLTNDELTSAIKVYNIVGKYVTFVEPALKAAFKDKDAALKTCTDAVNTAIGFKEGEDLAVAIANNGDKAFGTEGVLGDKCFGSADALKEFTFTPTGATKEQKVDADNTASTLITAEKKKADDAVTAQLKSTGADGSSDATSPAAVLSAAAALIAMML